MKTNTKMRALRESLLAFHPLHRNPPFAVRSFDCPRISEFEGFQILWTGLGRMNKMKTNTKMRALRESLLAFHPVHPLHPV